ncbi:hypothetical protein [Streptomyces mutomycini]|uniref:Secreted protein n=2 Tax=Streptomyces TaxID=1883 RepID=A0ABW0B0X9_9ACTN|nr:hypothetical protein [Streptomyces mutomycini]KPC78365.1 hypothetical protein ADK82_30505 [Streptomyces sp. NRRL S-4]
MTPNRVTWNRTVRRFPSAAAGALIVGLALGAAPAHGAERGADLPEFDFSTCPTVDELPAGADPGTWRCEVMHATGHLRMGAVDEPLTEPMGITFAEGRVDGEFRQVFGEMTAVPIRVGGTPLTLTPQYGGYSDFLSDDTRRGEFDIKFAIGSAHGLPARPSSGCSVGSDEDAVHLVLKDTDPTRVISRDPLVVAFGAQDAEFAAPGTGGCGPLSRVLDRALGLPSAAGANTFNMDVTVAIRSYT